MPYDPSSKVKRFRSLKKCLLNRTGCLLPEEGSNFPDIEVRVPITFYHHIWVLGPLRLLAGMGWCLHTFAVVFSRNFWASSPLMEAPRRGAVACFRFLGGYRLPRKPRDGITCASRGVSISEGNHDTSKGTQTAVY